MKPALSSLFRMTVVATWVVVAGTNPAWVQAQAAETPMAAHAHEASLQSTDLTVTVDGKAVRLSVKELQAMPQKTITVHNEHTKADESYSGVLLGDLLAKYGFPMDKTTHSKMLHSYVVATGTDKYWVLYSVTEVEGSEHNGDVIVAIAKDGKPLGEDGLFKLIASEDKRPQRWVRNLTALTLKSAE